MLANFDRSTVKHGTRNIQNDCHQWLSDSFRVHQIRFRPRALPRTPLGKLTALPDLLARLRGPTSKGEVREKGKEGNGKDPPPFANPGSAPGHPSIGSIL